MVFVSRRMGVVYLAAAIASALAAMVAALTLLGFLAYAVGFSLRRSTGGGARCCGRR